MRVMLLAIVPAVNSGGDVAYLLQCRFYLHKVVDVELHGIAVLLPHLAGYEDGIMQRPLGLFQSGLQSSTVYSPSCGGGTVPAPFFAGKFFSPITLQLLSPEMKSAYSWHTPQEHALTTADTKRAGSPTRSAGCLPSFCLFGQVSVTPLPLCRLFAFIGNRSGRLFRLLFSLAGLGRFLGRLFEVGEVRGEIHGVADSLCSGMDCLLEITV